MMKTLMALLVTYLVLSISCSNSINKDKVLIINQMELTSDSLKENYKAQLQLQKSLYDAYIGLVRSRAYSEESIRYQSLADKINHKMDSIFEHSDSLQVRFAKIVQNLNKLELKE